MEDRDGRQVDSIPDPIEPDISVDVVETTQMAESGNASANERLDIPQAIYDSLVAMSSNIDGVSPYCQENQRLDQFIAIIHPRMLDKLGDGVNAIDLSGYSQRGFRALSQKLLGDKPCTIEYRLGDNFMETQNISWNAALIDIAGNIVRKGKFQMANEIYQQHDCTVEGGSWPEPEGDCDDRRAAIEHLARHCLEILSQYWIEHVPVTRSMPQEGLQVYCL